MVTEKNKRIHKALNVLMEACGFQGESGTEELFDTLLTATANVHEEWNIVNKSHEDGLCYDVNGLLADAIEKVVTTREILYVGTIQGPTH